jgi:hypothetical protein
MWAGVVAVAIVAGALVFTVGFVTTTLRALERE